MDFASSFQAEILQVFKFAGSLLFAFILGMLTMVIALLCLFNEYTKSMTKMHEKRQNQLFQPVELTPLLHNNIAPHLPNQATQNKETAAFINIVLSFMFREWKDTSEIQRWVLKKINVELIELMESKTASRILQAIKIHNYNLGSKAPVIHGVKIVEPHCFNNQQLPDLVVLDVDLEYEGGFQLAVDVDLVFGKSAFISVGIKYLKGCVRLQVGRLPCTHWSVCFVQEPILKFNVDTSFETRKLPQLGTLLTNQIQRTIRKKHTFPHYKLRYNPLFSFQHSSQHKFDQSMENIDVHISKLSVTILACTRLAVPKKDSKSAKSVVYATISLDKISCESVAPIKVQPEIVETQAQAEDEPSHTRVEQPETNITPQHEATSNGNLLTPELTPSVETPKISRSMGQRSLSPRKRRLSPRKKSTPRKERIKKQKSTTPADNLSYLMITRNFSATLHEVTTNRPMGGKITTVNVKSITGNHQSYESRGIISGDRILEINGQKVESLSQAIAIIENVRSQKQKFQFKVQRNRSTSMLNKMNEDQGEAPERETPPTPPILKQDSQSDSAISTTTTESSETESDHSDIDSEEYNDFLKVDKKIKEIQRELEVESKSSPKQTPDNRMIDLHGNAATHSGNISTNHSPSHHDTDDVRFARLTQESSNNIFKTNACSAAVVDNTWKNETFQFEVESEHKYLNVRFWCDEGGIDAKSREPLLIGNLSIALFELDIYCNMITSNSFTRKYRVESPLGQELKLNIDESFTKRSAYRREYCFGDATIMVKINRNA